LTLAAHKPDSSSRPPILTDVATINSLPPLYQAVAKALIRRGRMILEEQEDSPPGMVPVGMEVSPMTRTPDRGDA